MNPPPPSTPGRPIPALDERGLPRGYPFRAEWEITPRETRDRLGAARGGGERVLLLDCRRVEEHALCRIEGSTLVPMDQIVARADEVEEAAGGKDAEVVVYCHTGRRSLNVTATLRGLGFTRVRSMAGGIELWSIDIDPGVPRY